MPSPRLLLAAAVLMSAGSPAQDDVWVLRGARVHSDPSSPASVQTVVVEGGKIRSVGTDEALPPGAREIDISGRWIVPAWIDAGNLGLFEDSDLSAGPSGASDRAIDLLAPFQTRTREQLLRSGVGALYAEMLPAGRAFKGCTGAVVWPDPTVPVPPAVVAEAGVTFRLGGEERGATNPTLRAQSVRNISGAIGAAERYKKSLEKYEKDLAEYREKLAKWEKERGSAPKRETGAEEAPKPAEASGGRGGLPARPADFDQWPPEKRAEWIRERMRSRGRRGGSGEAPASSQASDAKGAKPVAPDAPKEDVGSAAMLRVLDREIPLRVLADWKEDIEEALKIAKKHDLRLVILRGTEGWRMVDEIRSAGATVALGPSLSTTAPSLDTYRQVPDLASRLAAAGVPIAFMTAGAEGYRHDSVGLMAQLAVSAGLAQDAALVALTTGAAAALGLEDRLGRIAPGYDAVFQILSGPPLEPGTRVEQMMLGTKLHEVGRGNQ